MSTATTLRTMADLIDSPDPKWLADALKITGSIRLVHPDGRLVLAGREGWVRTSSPTVNPGFDSLWLAAADSLMVPIPAIPYPDSAGLDWLQAQASVQGWGGSDFEWERVSPFFSGSTGQVWHHCVHPQPPENAFRKPRMIITGIEVNAGDLARRDIALPNGQPAYVYAGQCPRCGVIYWWGA